MTSKHPSDSTVQQNMESLIIKVLEDKLGLIRGSLLSKRIPVGSTFVEFDGYSKEELIMCEVYAHIGELKGNQPDKAISDAMKMIFAEKVIGKSFRKIFAICDQAVEKQLTSSSWRSMALKEFGIEVIRLDIGEAFKLEIKEAQKLQKR